jgi:hypothetical protein
MSASTALDEHRVLVVDVERYGDSCTAGGGSGRATSCDEYVRMCVCVP